MESNLLYSEFVPHKEALDLMKLGYDFPCYGIYYDNNLAIITPTITNQLMSNSNIPAPLYQQAFKWFREKYKLHAAIDTGISGYYGHIKSNPIGRLPSQVENEWVNTEENPLNTHEEAELECLKKLIEIVKENKDGKDND